jgi:hypothetical protein
MVLDGGSEVLSEDKVSLEFTPHPEAGELWGTSEGAVGEHQMPPPSGAVWSSRTECHFGKCPTAEHT